MKTFSQVLAVWPRVVVCLVAVCTSVFLGFLAWAQLRIMLMPGSPVYALDVSAAVMLGTALVVMTDIAVRWFWYVCSGRLPRASRWWHRFLTWLLAASGAAVLVFLYLLNP